MTELQPKADFILLYVSAPEASADFYEKLMGVKPVDRAPTFALFALDTGLKLGLWKRDEVVPSVEAPNGSGELCFSVDAPAKVDAAFADWKAKGAAILQEPCERDFGRTFLAIDPDGNRLRVFAPGGP